jgi:hypothetical protein
MTGVLSAFQAFGASQSTPSQSPLRGRSQRRVVLPAGVAQLAPMPPDPTRRGSADIVGQAKQAEDFAALRVKASFM